ncbi:hypothetical protein C7S18_10110 [Ahniella affigens]|uniref:Uncharacterized protein n=1 Tax=Ahniella affigens TaxID=2021234 RepID=A0A2P1PRP8_9GAMM|nr:hypothetical protein [Ahniella affigens]AVP97527.1 hypothetical protein C7S18_10110 [Ahniella affigens]
MGIRLKRPTVQSEFDLRIYCCGYESRCTSVLEEFPQHQGYGFAVGYGYLRELAFEKNKAEFERRGIEYCEVSDIDFFDWLIKKLRTLGNKERIRVLVDISCLTRLRLGAVVQAFAQFGTIDASFAYSLAKFSPPGDNIELNEFVEPVSPFFSGWTGELDKPAALICGLGYEKMRAIGVVEHLEPADYWLFVPRSPLSDYDHEVLATNSNLLDSVSVGHVIDYRVSDPIDALGRLMSLTGVIRSKMRCSILPLGPKLFALCAMLVGVHFRDVSVWRASSGQHANPRDKIGSGVVVNLSVGFFREEDRS